MATLDELTAQLASLTRSIELIKTNNLNVDTAPLEDSLKRVKSQMNDVGSTMGKTKDTIEKSVRDSSSSVVEALGGASSAIGRFAQAVLEAGKGTMDYGRQFRQIFSGETLGVIGNIVNRFDGLTETTRNLRTSAIDVGNAFGLSFEETRASYGNYIASVLLAQNSTFENRQEIERQTKSLAGLGIGLEDIGRTFQIAGTQQNILSAGFLLASDSGLNTNKVFDMLGIAARRMGLSIEEAGRPIIAIENIARATGLPVQELADRVFTTAQQYARLGLTVDSISPVVRRFVDVLGPGFKGLAIEESTSIIRGLERQINSTNAAFLAMQGGLARPGAGVAEAQLAFEAAFENPIEIIKSLQTTIAGAVGGKIIKFEEARANPELATQFKIQRDLLQQLTGNTDPQSQRTLMNILADLQSGRQLTASQNKEVGDALKSGGQKQEEQRTLQERMGKAQVGLLTQIALNTSAFFERLLPPQAQAGFAKVALEGGLKLEQRAIEEFNRAMKTGEVLLGNKLPDGVKDMLGKARDFYNETIKTGEREAAEIRPGLKYSIPELPGSPAIPLPSLTTPSPFTLPTAPSTAGGIVPVGTAPVAAEGAIKNITITLKGDDEIGRLIAKHAAVKISETNHGR